MDDYSRYIIAWQLCTGMAAGDVSATLQQALKNAGLARKQRPRLLSDNGPCYVYCELQGWLEENEMTHTRGNPYHPMTQGKIERWHQSLKTASCWRTIICPAIWSSVLKSSSLTTTQGATMKA
jgi:transposase InsO family protein